MVDPKRHINILSPEEQTFLEECEHEFANRFTDLDEEFMAHCQRPAKPPPIVHPWNQWGRRPGGGGGGVGWRGERRFNDRGGRASYHARGARNQQYNRDYRTINRSGDNNRGGRDYRAPRPDHRPNDRSNDRPPYDQQPRRMN